MTISVSVIIPVYNVEKYLRQTLDCVVNQTLQNIEIICVDNNSQDNTVKIIQEYANKDNRIKLYQNKKNIKQGLARNFALSVANGDYIFYIDGDDYMELNCLEKLYNKITAENSDIVICQWNPFDDRTGKIIKGHVYSKLKQIPEEFDTKPFNWRDIKYSIFWQTSVPWDKMYKRTFLIDKKVEFPGEIFFEDNVFVYDALFKAEKISVLREELMFYRTNRKEAVTNTRNETFFDYLKIFNLIGDNLKKINLFDEMKYLYWDYKIITLYWWFMQIKPQFKKRFFEKIKEDFKQLEIKEEDKQFVRNRTLFLLDRFLKLPALVYYPIIFYFDKIFRIEYGINNYCVIWFSTFEKWHEYKKK